MRPLIEGAAGAVAGADAATGATIIDLLLTAHEAAAYQVGTKAANLPGKRRTSITRAPANGANQPPQSNRHPACVSPLANNRISTRLKGSNPRTPIQAANQIHNT